jgi:hypothetical protein
MRRRGGIDLRWSRPKPSRERSNAAAWRARPAVVETKTQPRAKRCGGVSDGSDVEITLRWSVSVLMDRRQVWTVPTAAPLPLAAGSRLGRRIHLKLSSENGVKG